MKRIPTSIFVLFSLISIFIYPIYWLYTRTKYINDHYDIKINKILIFTCILSEFYLIFHGLFVGFISGFHGNYELYESNDNNFSHIIWIISIIFEVFTCISIRDSLKSTINDNEYNSIEYNIILLIIFRKYYLNYKINEIYEHQDGHNDNIDYYNSVEERLESIKILKEKGLINDSDYELKKDEILKEL